MACTLLYSVLVLSLFSFTNAIDLVMEEECLNYTVYPLQYELNIYPYVNGGQSYFDCEIKITVIANAPNVRVIELDAKDLNINHIKVLDGHRNIISSSRPLEFNSVHGKLYIYLQEPLKMYHANNKQYYSIQISYRKLMKEDGSGIFLVKYYDEQSKDYK